jgi:hypothetical protein
MIHVTATSSLLTIMELNKIVKADSEYLYMIYIYNKAERHLRTVKLNCSLGF